MMRQEMVMAQEPAKKEKSVIVTGFPNIAPAGIAITKMGKGSSLAIAICRGVSAVLKDERVKSKRNLFPIKFVVTE